MTVAFWAWVVAYAWFQWLPRAQYTIAFVGLSVLVYLLHEYTELEADDRQLLQMAGLSVLAVVTIVTTVYLYGNYNTLVTTRVGYALYYEEALAAVFTIGMIYLTYRSFGLAFVSVLLFAIVYGYFGNYFPGVLVHGGFSTTRILNIMVLEINGFYGELSEIIAAWVALFLLYAGLLKAYGAFDLIIRAAFRTATLVKSGVAQSAVVASLVIGSINGSQTANAAMTGSFTIPLMKSSGLKSETAGGVESVASTGGQIMPPVMGAAAFVMASLLGIAYIDVVIAGLVPAAIFFLSVAAGVHYTWIAQSGESDLDVTDHVDEVKSQSQLLVEGFTFAVPLVVLIVLLGVLQWTVMTSALYTVITMIAFGVGVPVVSATLRDSQTVAGTLKTKAVETVEGFRYGAVILAPIAIIIAAVNGIVDVLVSTGIPGILSLMLMDLSGGVMVVAVVLAMVICILLGLGMPTVAAYSLVALLIAPTLITEFAIPDLAAHYFVLYAAILSGITPPIAIAVVVTAGIAESNFWTTCLEAIKLAAPLYVLPFAFVYNPEIVVGGFTTATMFSGALALLGAVYIIHGLNYYERAFATGRATNAGIRVVFVALGTIAMVAPVRLVQVGALALGTVLYLAQTSAWRRTSAPTSD
ncbi:TRAP transporter fused permease subunit [Salinadaptatus halalkaliphilus]|uniref:TRAP transporter fused permease subunit n=1 Tax=Salinadaptatus halalkaliphilus TaxID=2419781 RepID=A0A4S3TKJ7_9EURY|nr:TRAP transporter fused permease subunit [Salinadaptatus halalkaliphilus]